jgi:glycerol-3-phosphate dehydrogenase (NAD(P)+)
MIDSIGIIGAGSWGTTLAILLSEKGYRITLWVRREELLQKMKETRENSVYLPGFKIPDSVILSHSLKEAVKGQTLIISAVPSHVTRLISQAYAPYLNPQAIVVSATKGIEVETLLCMSEVLAAVLPQAAGIGVLSGPSFAREVCQHLPTAVVAASFHREVAEFIQKLFTTSYFRVYTNLDVIGVELAGALKNVIALAAGISDGLGYGTNSRAALITRGLAEITRLGIAMGAQPLTFAGLAGIGDLVLTCTGELSRNRQVGLAIGKGQKLNEIIAQMQMVAEGIKTTQAAVRLAKRHAVEMPITEQVYAMLFEGKNPADAVAELMGRSLKPEHPVSEERMAN